MGTALAIDPALPNKWQQGENCVAELAPIMWKNKPLASLAYMAVVKYQLTKQSQNMPSNASISPLWALIQHQIQNLIRVRNYRSIMTKLSRD